MLRRLPFGWRKMFQRSDVYMFDIVLFVFDMNLCFHRIISFISFFTIFRAFKCFIAHSNYNNAFKVMLARKDDDQSLNNRLSRD